VESRGEKNASDDVLVVDDDVSELDFFVGIIVVGGGVE